MKLKYASLLNASEPYILQLANCVSRRPTGLSAEIAKRYPYCQLYTNRLGTGNIALESEHPMPGTLEVYRGVFPHDPVIVCMISQFFFSKPFLYGDSNEQRLIWFNECLQLVGLMGVKQVAVPYGIGSGSGTGGKWLNYYNALEHFEQHYQVGVTLYHTTRSTDDRE